MAFMSIPKSTLPLNSFNPDIFDFLTKSSKAVIITLVFVLMLVAFIASLIKSSGNTSVVLIIGLLLSLCIKLAFNAYNVKPNDKAGWTRIIIYVKLYVWHNASGRFG